MAARTHDYDTLHREFIGSEISIRALCEKHDIKGFSTVAKYARDHGWYDERDRVRGRKRDKVVERVSDKLAEEEADAALQFREESLTIIRAALYRFAEDLRDPSFHVLPGDLAKLVQLGLLVTGGATERVEERRLDVTANLDGLPADIIRGLVEATRPRIALSGSARLPARVGPEEPRPN